MCLWAWESHYGWWVLRCWLEKWFRCVCFRLCFCRNQTKLLNPFFNCQSRFSINTYLFSNWIIRQFYMAIHLLPLLSFSLTHSSSQSWVICIRIAMIFTRFFFIRMWFTMSVDSAQCLQKGLCSIFLCCFFDLFAIRTCIFLDNTREREKKLCLNSRFRSFIEWYGFVQKDLNFGSSLSLSIDNNILECSSSTYTDRPIEMRACTNMYNWIPGVVQLITSLLDT